MRLTFRNIAALRTSSLLRPGPDPKPKLRGDTRTYRVWLDPNQYQQDMTSSIQNSTEDPYETFNIIMRRKPKENNFKVVPWCSLSLHLEPSHPPPSPSLLLPPSPSLSLYCSHTHTTATSILPLSGKCNRLNPEWSHFKVAQRALLDL